MPVCGFVCFVRSGIVPTKFAAALVASPELEEEQKSRTLLGRLGRVQDIAAVVAFLCSDDAAYVTGETIVASGGMQSRL
jgi:dehydrogenase/reductase SDR family protein 4